MKRLHLMALSLVLAGCSHIDTGQADYRIADATTALSSSEVADYAKTACPDTKKACGPMISARLLRKYQPGFGDAGRPFTNTDVYSIDIQQGVIGNKLLEGVLLGKEFDKTGEFAILANVFEFSPNKEGTSANRFVEFGPTDRNLASNGDIELALVYYSGDVRRHQPFNFSNIPLKPRTQYTGGSIAVQLIIMEIDAQSGPMKALLTTLAKFGQQLAPIPAPAKNLLFDLGESIVNGGTSDDRILDYRFVLSAPTVDADQPRAVFAPGQYVIRRVDQRDTEPEWSDLVLDRNTGRLMRKTDSGQFVAAREELYLVLDVKRFAPTTKAEYYQSQGWKGFRDALQAAVDQRDAPVQTVADNLSGMLATARAGDWETRLLGQWQEAEYKLGTYSRRIVSSLPAGCAARENGKFEEDLAEREARLAIEAFRATYQEALLAATHATKPELNEFPATRKGAVMNAVARYFMPWADEAPAAMFKDPASFEAAFIGAPANDKMIDAAITKARRLTPASC